MLHCHRHTCSWCTRWQPVSTDSWTQPNTQTHHQDRDCSVRLREGLGYKTARQPSCHVGSADRGSSSKHNSALDSAFYNTVGLLSIDPLPRPNASTTRSPPPSSQRPSLTRWSQVDLRRPLLKQLRQSGHGLPHSHWAHAGHEPLHSI